MEEFKPTVYISYPSVLSPILTYSSHLFSSSSSLFLFIPHSFLSFIHHSPLSSYSFQSSVKIYSRNPMVVVGVRFYESRVLSLFLTDLDSR